MKKRNTLVIILALVYSFSFKSIAQELKANFTSNITNGCNSINVSFSNLSTPNSALTYFWDFGNGVTSVVSNPNVFFAEPGNYDVRLIVSNGSKSDTLIKEKYINVFHKPTAVFTSNSGTVGCAPFKVEFNNQSLIGDTTINFWHWDFGDGFISAAKNPAHVFNFQSSFSVSLYIRDKNNCENLITVDKFITAYKPTTSFTLTDSVSCSGSLNARFINNSTGIGSLSYKWDLGNSTTSTLQNPQINYTKTGNYDIQLITTDGHSCTDTLMKKSLISINEILAGFTVKKDTVCINENILFTNTSSKIFNCRWDFGDGIFSDQVNPNHKYTSYGDYLVKLTISIDKGCSNTFTKKINVEKVIADFSSSQNFSCDNEVQVNYLDKSVNALKWDWRFGNKIKSNLKNPSVTYNAEGIYSDTLIVTSKNGCKNTKVVNPSLTIAWPHASFTPNNWVEVNNLKGCTPLTVNFVNQSTYLTKQDSIKSWLWDFGDGTTSATKNPSHVFNGTANYQVSLKLTTTKGCVSYYGATAKTGTKQNAEFEKDVPDIVCASTAVQFIDKSENQELINEWYWIFGDGKTSLKQNPSHIFVDTGYMEVQLMVYHNGCADDNVKSKFIYIKGPIVNPDYLTNCSNPLMVNFQNNAILADKMYWHFGDGSPIDSISKNPTHTYASRGEYTSKLRAVNSTNGCSFEMEKKVLIRTIKAEFKVDINEGCPGLNVKFNPEISMDEYIYQYQGREAKYLWNFDDGSEAFNSQIPFSHQFNEKGNYHVKLKVKDFRGCEDSTIQQINIYKPEPVYIAKNFAGCMPMSVDFVNNSISEAPVDKWLWEFGDNTNSNDKNPKHIYTKYGQYNISLTVTDNLGCSSKVTKANFIEALKPSPDFTASDQTACIGDSILFSCLAKDSIHAYKWDFGDGTFSTLSKPIHVYKNKNLYPVTLRLVDVQGCDSIKTMNNFIDIQAPPKVKFEADQTFTNCFPLVVHFTDKSEGLNMNKWDWTFDENQSESHIQNPIHTFTEPGVYDIGLQVTTTNGCTSANFKENLIEIKGPWAKIIAPDTICKNSPVSLSVTDKKNVYDLLWFFNDGTVGIGDSVKHTYKTPGMITPALLLISDEFHTCDKYFVDTFFMNTLKASIYESENNQSGCVPYSINFINQSIGAKSFAWTFGDGGNSKMPNPLYQYQHEGNFKASLIATNNFGCTDTAFSAITVFSLPKIQIIKDTLICRGNSLKLWASGAKSYTWFPGQYLDSEEIYNPLSTPPQNMNYEVMAVDSNNCVNYSNVNIAVQQVPIITIPDTTIIIGEIVEFNAFAKDLLSYKWSPSTGLNNTNSYKIMAQPLESTTYKLTVVDTNRCFTVSKEIKINIRKEYTIDVPSAFTPNGDGINDKIFVKGWGVKEVVDFRIYNRFGGLVFETHDKNQGWDGIYKGNNQNVETYTYYVKVRTFENDIREKSGTIKLLK